MYNTARDADRALLALSKDIAEHLDSYTAVHDGTGITLHGDNGTELGVAFCGHPVGTRIAITAYPPEDANEWHRKQLKAKITMATERGAEAIADRITRDVLPGYLAVIDQVKADIAERAAQLAKRDRLAIRIEALIPNARTLRPAGPSETVVLQRGDRWADPKPDELAFAANLDTGTASFSIHGCDPILTMRIAEAIADFDDRHRLDTTDPGRED